MSKNRWLEDSLRRPTDSSPLRCWRLPTTATRRAWATAPLLSAALLLGLPAELYAKEVTLLATVFGPVTSRDFANDAGPEPIPGAFVTVTVEGEGTVTGFADDAGLLSVDLPEDGGAVLITVSKEGFWTSVIEFPTVAHLMSASVAYGGVLLPTSRHPEDEEIQTASPDTEIPVEVWGVDPVPTDNATGTKLFETFERAPFLPLFRDLSTQQNNLYSGGEEPMLMGSGARFEGDEQSIWALGGDGNLVQLTPFVDSFFPALAAITWNDEAEIIDSSLDILSGLTTDGAQAVLRTNEDGDQVPHFVYPDAGVFNFRGFDHVDGVNVFTRNYPFPPSLSGVGPANGGVQFQAVDTSDSGLGVGFTYTRTVDDLPDVGDCAPFTRQLEYRFTQYDGDGNLLSDTHLLTFDGLFGPGCGLPIFANATRFDENRVVFVFGEPSSRMLRLLALDLEQTPPGVTEWTSPTEWPDELDGLFFNIGVREDTAAGALNFGAPGDEMLELSGDALRLGQNPWANPTSFVSPRRYETGVPIRWGTEGGRISQIGPAESTDGARERRADTDLTDSTTVRVPSLGGTSTTVLRRTTLPGCADTTLALCLNDNRFALFARYLTPAGAEGPGRARPLSNDSGTFWFFEQKNRELIAKVLDGCGVNGHYWVFLAGLTNVGVELHALDMTTGRARVYVNPVGRTYEPVFDVEAFDCNEEEAGRARAARASTNGPRSEWQLVRSSAPDGTACGGEPGDLCLNDGRFRVEVEFTDFEDTTAPAFGGNLTDDTGALFFFDRSNVELLIKVLDACFAGRYWVFAAGLTNVGVEIRVTDTETGQSTVYRNPVGTDFQAITDTATFSCS